MYGSSTNNTPSAAIESDSDDGSSVTVPDRPEIPGQIPDPGTMPPPEYGATTVTFRPVGSAEGGAPTQVNTDAIKAFATNLESLDDPVRTALTTVGDIDIRAGGFFAAHELADSIGGTGKLRDGTQSTLTKTLDALAAIRAASTKIVQRYESAEDLNAATSQNLQQYIAGADGVINS
ncbi:MAG: hypothetical protein ABW215_18170, partial [Kibdelosporangium sp.]